jgi:NitT/TauT family transport system permease protein
MVSMKPTAAYGIFFGMSSTSARISKETYMSDKVSQEPSRTAPGAITAAASGAAARSMGAISVTLIRFAIVIGFFALWEIASGRWIEPFLISSPSRIFTSLISGFREGDLFQHSWVTLIEIAIGFPIGAIAGIGLGYAFGRSRVLADIFEPIIIALNGIPRTALAPLFIVWLGIGVWSKVGVVFLLTFFLNFFNTYTGMRQMDHEYVDLANLMGVKGWKLTFKVIFPAISPYVFTGIRTSIPFAVIGAIVGEFVAATEGVGFFIRMSAGIFRTADVFVGIIVLMIMVIIMDKIAAIIEKRALRWQTQTEHIQIQA